MQQAVATASVSYRQLVDGRVDEAGVPLEVGVLHALERDAWYAHGDTAYIALRLVDEGKLSLNKSLFSYLSKEWMPYSIYQDSIKLNHVLSHSSGLNKITREIMFKPGSAYFYSANGFNLVKD